MNRLLIFAPLIYSVSLVAQTVKPDTAFVKASIDNARQVYIKTMQGQSDLYNGSDYVEYLALRSGEFPFFSSEDWTDGSILYAGESYRDIGLLYDICRDIVVIEHFYNHSMMQLVTEKIDWFSFGSHRFVKLAPDDKSGLREGFYELIYDGKTKFYGRYEKKLERTIQNQRMQFYFAKKTTYYIFKDGVFYTVGSKTSVLSLLDDRKRDMKKFLSEKKIRFGENREKAIAAMVAYYDSITK